MMSTESKPGSFGPAQFRRKNVQLSSARLVRISDPAPATVPLKIEPNIEGLRLITWAEHNGEFINTHLLRHGAILFRDFQVAGVSDFEEFVRTVSGDLLNYEDRTSPRRPVKGNVFSSTYYPPEQEIFLHNENSYSHTWPLKIFFHCAQPADEGGETPIADVRRIYQRLSPSLRDNFTRKKVMYVRNFGNGFGLTWQDAFQTRNPAKVEEFCRNSGIEFEWKAQGRLKTRQVRPVVAIHPITNERVWFNHAAFFHVSTLEPAVREALLTNFAEEDLPYNTYYGDGSPIEPAVLDEIRRAYREEAIYFPWQKGDVLMLDNMLTAHGRSSFVGPREILAAMSEPRINTD
jgi:alpha-ketoglutarate-dependent taurine dioxygenase